LRQFGDVEAHGMVITLLVCRIVTFLPILARKLKRWMLRIGYAGFGFFLDFVQRSVDKAGVEQEAGSPEIGLYT
jgi:hypothetical protein